MRCHDHLKLPKAVKLDMITCVKVDMSNEESYTVKEGDLVAIQFIKDDRQILVRRGRVKDLVVINDRAITNGGKTECGIPHVSHIILDCSEQFSINVIEIKIKDVIKIADINYDFNDYTERVTSLEKNYIDGNKIPVRQGGMITKEEAKKRVTKLDKDNVIKSDNEDDGKFDDLYEMNLNKPNIEDLRATEEEEDAAEAAAANKAQGSSPKALVYRGIPLMM